MSFGPEWAILSFRPERIMCISFSWWVSSRALQPISLCIITTSLPIIPMYEVHHPTDLHFQCKLILGMLMPAQDMPENRLKNVEYSSESSCLDWARSTCTSVYHPLKSHLWTASTLTMNNDKLRRRRMMLIRAAASVASCMVTLYVQSRPKRKKESVAYGPIEERDKNRIAFLNNQIYKDDITCLRTLRLMRAPFFRLCQVLRERSLLHDTIHISIEEQVAMFLITVGHNLRNREVGAIFNRSGEPVSRYFGLVLHAIGELRDELIRPPSLETPTKIAGNPRWDPYFKDCVGAIDSTQIQASVSKNMEAAFCGKKSSAGQNVIAAIDFDLRFTYVLAGCDASAHDDAVLMDAIECENGLRVPEGKFYLVDAGYGAKPGFLPPFCGVRYYLNEWGNNPAQDARELFNLRHSSLRVTVERAFSSLKRRFKILDDAAPFFPPATQTDAVIACVILHNWILSQGTDCFILPESSWAPNSPSSQREQAHDHRHMVEFRQALADKMWEDGQNYEPLVANVTENENVNGESDTFAAAIEEFTLPFPIPKEGINGDSSSSKAPKRAKLNNDDDLIHLMTRLDDLTKAIEKSGSSDTHVPEDLWGNLMHLPGFQEAYLTHYYAHLIENPAIARAFNKLSMSNKMIWVSRHISVSEEENANGESDTFAAAVEEFTLPFPIPKEGNTGDSSSSKAPKRAKLNTDDELIHLMTRLDDLTKAIEKSGSSDTDVPEDLWGNLMVLPGFQEAYLTHYYAHLVENPATATAFNKLSMSNKMIWVSRYISSHLSG
ncbi:uncharacterized protein LOC100832632 isoform X2 [Brachypodium distachyon]|uniref:uncharacterized protein LOC100832632 isoform X2 n=1 Tax=Brachypodium distachyon TaxID=15368 RepID=UPI00071C79C8|nr:uncharacterized protein LOC100832632 isoform X2 [Brachypodium distachyon]|eukprot:XP_024315389.1 uncharacterized protein LOC100832632 isoform X2 [Brachypodium distachyon]